MELEDTGTSEVVEPNDAGMLPEVLLARPDVIPVGKPKSFGERYSAFCGAIDAPEDLAAQHEHYRLGTPKR